MTRPVMVPDARPVRAQRGVLAATLLGMAMWAGCTVSIVDPGDGWPEVEQMQLAVNGMTVKLRRGGGISGPIPVLLVGDNPVAATAFRQYYGGIDPAVEAPRFALELLPTPNAALMYRADSVNGLRGTLVATATASSAAVRVMLVETATGRIHFGPVTLSAAIIDR